MFHRAHHLFIRQQTAVIHSIRALPSWESSRHVEMLMTNGCPRARVSRVLGAQLWTLKAQILNFDRMITAWHRSNETSKRLDELPGVGPAPATALVASIAHPKVFRSGRDFTAWVGLVPKQSSNGGKQRFGGISKCCWHYVGNFRAA